MRRTFPGGLHRPRLFVSTAFYGELSIPSNAYLLYIRDGPRAVWNRAERAQADCGKRPSSTALTWLLRRRWGGELEGDISFSPLSFMYSQFVLNDKRSIELLNRGLLSWQFCKFSFLLSLFYYRQAHVWYRWRRVVSRETFAVKRPVFQEWGRIALSKIIGAEP